MTSIREADLERLAQDVLKQLYPHSPAWVKILRSYIRQLKRKK